MLWLVGIGGVCAVGALVGLSVWYRRRRHTRATVTYLADAIDAWRARQRAAMAVEAARILELVEAGELADAAVATAALVEQLNEQHPPAGTDIAVVRALAAVTRGYASRRGPDDVGRSLQELERNVHRLGDEARALAVTELHGVAAALAARGQHAGAAKARSLALLVTSRGLPS